MGFNRARLVSAGLDWVQLGSTGVGWTRRVPTESTEIWRARRGSSGSLESLESLGWLEGDPARMQGASGGHQRQTGGPVTAGWRPSGSSGPTTRRRRARPTRVETPGAPGRGSRHPESGHIGARSALRSLSASSVSPMTGAVNLTSDEGSRISAQSVSTVSGPHSKHGRRDNSVVGPRPHGPNRARCVPVCARCVHICAGCGQFWIREGR